MSIESAKAAIRESRKLRVDGTDPYTWSILSTSGDYRHVVVWDEKRLDLVCATCEAKYAVGRCWARTRVQDWLKARFEKAGDAQNAPAHDRMEAVETI